MRLEDTERDVIRGAVKKRDHAARIYLFGSRVCDDARGGDIDLLVISDDINRRDLADIEYDIFSKIEERKIDFVLTDRSTNNAFARMILEGDEKAEL